MWSPSKSTDAFAAQLNGAAAPVPARSQDVLGICDYGERFATVVEKDSFYGVQFHPEKSSAAGLRLLANFTRICAAAPTLSSR